MDGFFIETGGFRDMDGFTVKWVAKKGIGSLEWLKIDRRAAKSTARLPFTVTFWVRN